MFHIKIMTSPSDEETNIKTSTIGIFGIYFLGAALLPSFPPLGIAIMVGGGLIAAGI